MVKTTVYLPEHLKARLERIAGQKGCSEAELIRAAVDEYTIAQTPRPRLPLFESLGEPQIADRVDELLAEGFGRD
ncbi:MAG: CopG family transcriptional regulator [Gaiellaceae bacterium]